MTLAREQVSIRVRAEVVAEKQLTPVQAKRLMGSTREELAADADGKLLGCRVHIDADMGAYMMLITPGIRLLDFAQAEAYAPIYVRLAYDTV